MYEPKTPLEAFFVSRRRPSDNYLPARWYTGKGAGTDTFGSAGRFMLSDSVPVLTFDRDTMRPYGLLPTDVPSDDVATCFWRDWVGPAPYVDHRTKQLPRPLRRGPSLPVHVVLAGGRVFTFTCWKRAATFYRRACRLPSLQEVPEAGIEGWKPEMVSTRANGSMRRPSK